MKKVILVAACTLVVFTVATLWANSILGGESKSLLPNGMAPLPSEVGKTQIGIVNQRLFELEVEAQNKRESQLEQLGSYGWLDRDQRIIHVPINRVMEQMADEGKQ